jgi:hypothetical protein
MNDIMKTKIEKGNWKEQKEELKQKFEFLTGCKQNFDECKNGEMFGKLRIKLGKTKNEWRKIIAAL